MRAYFRLLLPLTAMLILSTNVHAVLSIDFDSGSITRNYLLDSEANDGDDTTNRHTAQSNFSVTFEVDGTFESHTGTYRIAYQLLDEDDNALELEGINPGLTQDLTFSASQSVSISTFAIAPATPTPSRTIIFTAQPDPKITLAVSIPRVPMSRSMLGFSLIRSTGIKPPPSPVAPLTIASQLTSALRSFVGITIRKESPAPQSLSSLTMMW